MIVWLKSSRAKFQSSPTSQGGRYSIDSIQATLGYTFQSSPTSQGGRYTSGISMIVRICCFNPRPPRKVGATISFRGRLVCDRVSILAHLARWALPSKCHRLDHQGVVSILAHLARWALLLAPPAWPAVPWCFNPRPPRKVGATKSELGWGSDEQVSILAHLARWALPGHASIQKDAEPCFNPRPPRKVGATSFPGVI